MKTERRHELATNFLADWLGAKIEEIKPYSTAILATLMGVIVAGGAFVYMNRRSGDRTARDWQHYFLALDESLKSGEIDSLRDAVDTMGASEAGLWARLSLADNQLTKGLEQLFTDRTKANELLQSAVDNYKKTREGAAARSFLDERATLGLAQAYESLNLLDKAEEEYASIKSKWPQSTFLAEAERRLGDLQKPSTKAFYDWFARQEPKPPKSDGPGEPGAKPKFDMNNLEDEHPFKSGLNLDDGDESIDTSRNPATGTGKVTRSKPDAADEADSDGDGEPADDSQPDEDSADTEDSGESTPEDAQP